MERSRVSVNDLAKACARSADAAEWEEFLRRCAPLASVVVLRVCRLWMNATLPAMVDDIVQEVFLKLCEQERRILREFAPRGEDSFLGLLHIVSASVANDHFRRLYSVKRGGKVITDQLTDDTQAGQALTAREANSFSSHGQDVAQMQRAVLYAQLDWKMRSAPEIISERDRAIFWLYYVQGLTAQEIARIPGTELSAKGVESALRRTTKWLQEEIGLQESKN
jgi:RNA polymerase sigma-70 factor (ECF subfamily)